MVVRLTINLMLIWFLIHGFLTAIYSAIVCRDDQKLGVINRMIDKYILRR
jgi:hypothetical protein